MLVFVLAGVIILVLLLGSLAFIVGARLFEEQQNCREARPTRDPVIGRDQHTAERQARLFKLQRGLRDDVAARRNGRRVRG